MKYKAGRLPAARPGYANVLFCRTLIAARELSLKAPLQSFSRK